MAVAMTEWQVGQKVKIFQRASLTDFTTFALGGPCRLLMVIENSEELVGVLQRLIGSGEPWLVLGEGSNTLVSDRGWDGVVIRYCTENASFVREGDKVLVDAAVKLDDLSHFAAQEGLAGLTFASGIPGTVGGAIVGNAGAFGSQIGDHLEAVVLFNAQTGTIYEEQGANLGFHYRRSNLQDGRAVVLKAIFRLTPTGGTDYLLAERERILALRRSKHPDWRREPCAGSVFRNIEKADGTREGAGVFLEKCGAKEMIKGGAAVFPKHANIVIKARPDCRSADVYALLQQMRLAVKEKFGITLVPEIRFVGDFR